MDYTPFLSPLGRALQESVLRKMGQVIAQRTDLVSFAAGYPDPAGFPWADLRQIAAELLSGDDPSTLQYGPTRGHRPLLEALVDVMATRGVRCDVPELLTTSGSQQGLDLIARVLIAPGDTVLVEVPTYSGAVAAFRNAQCRLVGVRQGAAGIDLDDLDAVLLRERAAGARVNLLYLVPNFHNPSGSLLALDARRRLLDWAERRHVLLIEDDPYGALYFDDVTTAAETRPMKADDQAGRVVYLSSFSKTLAPGFRVAWMVAPAPLAERFETAKQSMDLMCGVLDQRIVHQAVVRGVVDRQAGTLRRIYRERRDVMVAALGDAFGEEFEWTPPRGGFFLWGRLRGVSSEVLLERALDEGVIFVTGGAFCVDGTGNDFMRLSFSWPSHDRIQDGVRRLARAMAACRGNGTPT